MYLSRNIFCSCILLIIMTIKVNEMKNKLKGIGLVTLVKLNDACCYHNHSMLMCDTNHWSQFF